jgi:glycosyltransferase involved in cell wall biosynthesis
MVKISIDGTPVFPQATGVGFYVAKLIESLRTLQAQDSFELEISYQPGLKKWLRGDLSIPDILKAYGTSVLPIPVRISNLLLDYYCEPAISYFEKYFNNPDIVHGTNYTVYPCNQSLKVMSIYDLTFMKYPEYTNLVVKTYIKRVQQCLKWTDLVLTISESSKQDIVEYLGVKPEKVCVTPLASRYKHNYLSTISTQTQHKLIAQAAYDFSQPYLLFVSTIEPRKNIEAIVTAFNQLKKQAKIPHHLVLIGKKGWHYEPIFRAIENSPYKQDIHHLDYLSDELVALFYAKADVFVYPSHYEGFGLPVLEAMTLGTPVVSSQTSSIPEVAGDAALLIDPNNPVQLADSILNVINDSQLRQELIQKGKKQAQLFSWERTAKETLKAYKNLTL